MKEGDTWLSGGRSSIRSWAAGFGNEVAGEIRLDRVGEYEEVIGDRPERQEEVGNLSGEPCGPWAGPWICILVEKGSSYGFLWDMM